MASEWEKVAENMVRHKPSGGLYLRAKVGGKIIRKSLGLKAVRPAKIKRDAMLAELRAQAGVIRKGQVLSVDDALTMTLAWFESRPSHELKDSTKVCKRQFIEVLRKTLPKNSPTLWTPDDIDSWWNSSGVTRYSPPRRNSILDTLRKMFSLMIDKNLRIDDPSTKIKRITVRSKIPAVPSQNDFRRVLKNMRDQDSRSATECANMIAFLAYSGCRIGEARCVEWQHVSKDSIMVTGGEEGTKNRETRPVPIIPPMRALLDSMRYDGAAGPLFSIKSPRFSLINACDRLGIDRFTPHTCRHMFATVCIESGVDIPTVAKWLGHKDGGALAMRVYGHLRDEHSLAQAQKVQF